MKKLVLLFLGLLFLSSIVTAIETPLDEEGKLNVYFFHSLTCSHCRDLMPVLEEWDRTYPDMKLHMFEVSENMETFQIYSNIFNTSTAGVPRVYVNDKAFIGFTAGKGDLEYDKIYKGYRGYENQIFKEIALNLPESIVDLPEEIPQEEKAPFWLFLLIPLYLLSLPLVFKSINSDKSKRRFWIAGLFFIAIISLFLFIFLTPEIIIKNFAETLPFPLFVFVLALADGFNPCSFTVLLILLSLLTYTKRRKDMVVFGSTFVIVSAIMYFIFIMIMILVGSWALQRYGHIILIILGIFITIAGIINLKDYLFFKKGVSLTLSNKEQTKVTKKARDIVHKLKEAKNLGNYLIALGATVVLAIVVNLVELGCTAILPVIYMASLIGNFGETVGAAHIIWTLFYSVIYIIPIFAILMNFIYSFKSTRLTEEQGRVLKLVAGLFMLFFGLLMIFRPGILALG